MVGPDTGLAPPSCAVREHQVSRTVRRLKAPFNSQPPVFDLISRSFTPREFSLVLVFRRVGITAIGVLFPDGAVQLLGGVFCFVPCRRRTSLSLLFRFGPPTGTAASLALALPLAVFVVGFDSAL